MNEQRDAAAVRIFPPAVPLFTILLGIGLNRVWPIDSGFALGTPERYWVGGAIVMRFAILPEEAYLERKFGDTYLTYKRRVRRWL
jgi:protein-S-isoprenylcysteine O-methyltransferase Ste14